MSHHQLTQTNRIEIAILFRTGMSHRGIGRQIGCHHSTVSRELSRHSWHNPSGYDARQARLQLKQTRLTANQSKRKLPVNKELVTLITLKLRSNWSPEQISGWLRDAKQRFRVSAQTIYDWLYLHAKHLLKHLHCQGPQLTNILSQTNWVLSEAA
jgi:transposase, IS30 family